MEYANVRHKDGLNGGRLIPGLGLQPMHFALPLWLAIACAVVISFPQWSQYTLL